MTSRQKAWGGSPTRRFLEVVRGYGVLKAKCLQGIKVPGGFDEEVP